MKIFLCSLSNWNVINFRESLIKELINADNQVYILSKKDNNYQRLLNLGCKIVNINFKNRSYNFLNDLFTILQICYYTIIIRPDIFISFNLKPIIFSKLSSSFFQKKNIINITGIGDSLSSKNNSITKFLVINLYKIIFSRNLDTIFFQNNDDMIFFKKKKIINNSFNYKIIPGSGVNLDYFKYKRIPDNNCVTFSYIGRLLKTKGINTFLQSIKKINDLKLEQKMQFVIVGDYRIKNDFDYKLFKQVLNFTNVKYYSFNNNIKKFIYDSQCVVLPSFREGTSKILLEALSCGRPIITSNQPGCAYLVNNYKNGFICKKDNSNSLIDCFKKFSSLSYEKKLLISQNAREFAKNYFNEKIVIKEYMDNIK